MYENILQRDFLPVLSTLKLGNPYSPPLIFLHGFLGSSIDFLPMMEMLSADFYCVSIDLPGHGLSLLPASLSFTSVMRSILTTLKRLKITQRVFVGYSLGGRLALMLHTSRLCEKSIILSAHPGLLPHERTSYLLQQKKWLSLLQNDPQNFLSLWYSQPLFKTLHANSMAEKRSSTNLQNMSKVISSLSLLHQRPLWKDLENIHPSPLFLCGEHDEKYKTLYKKLPNHCAQEIISGASHAIHLENPSECSTKIQTFLFC